MKRNLIQIAAAAAITAGMALAQQAPAAPQASPQTPAHRPMVNRMRHRMMSSLNLTDAQKQQAKAIFQETKAKSEPIRAQLRQNRESLSAAVKSNNAAAIQKLSKTEGELMGRLMVNRNESRAQFYNILTPEQRTKVDQMHSAFRQRMERRRGASRSNG